VGSALLGTIFEVNANEDGVLRERLTVHFPLFGLRVRTPRVTLQLPTDPELLELLAVIDDGVHDLSWMPFQIAWTDTEQPQRDRDSLAHWWRTRADWSPTDWTWSGAVRVAGSLVGVQNMGAKNFSSLHEVSTGSWIGLRHQSQGIGKEMRAAMLHFAFEGLGAERAHSGYLEGNEASRKVSEALGYEPNGYTYVTIRGEPLRETNVVLERERWAARRRDDIEIEGLDACRDLFGA
jgi:RimJ/RimL family protein N-acetyltransferase